MAIQSSLKTRQHQANKLLQRINFEEIKVVDIRFTALYGQCLQTSICASALGEHDLIHGIPISGAIAGWKHPTNSDLIIVPNLNNAFTMLNTYEGTQRSLVLFGSAHDPSSQQPLQNDPRNIAVQALAALRSSGIASKCLVGPEIEFSIFDDVNFEISTNRSHFDIKEVKSNHSLSISHSYYGQSYDRLYQIREKILGRMEDAGLHPLGHHHEAAIGQSEIKLKPACLLSMADKTQLTKSIIQNTAESSDKVVSFMPQPLNGQGGNGFHINISLWNEEHNLFAASDSSKISELAQFFIGGILKHIKTLNCICNPNPNSYKRLSQAFYRRGQASYSYESRLTGIRVPMATSPENVRIELRFPDNSCNPYLAFSAVLMAGLDGISKKRHLGKPTTGTPILNANRPPFRHPKGMARDLYEASSALHEDRAFLLRHGVFNESIINALITHSISRHEQAEDHSTPIEFANSYC